MTASGRQPCTAADLGARGSFSLPVLRDHEPRGEIRRSKSGRRRAVVLGIVQVLMIAHVVLWVLSSKYGWWGGRTLTPVEPSESMEFVKHGVVNAGLIFFAATLLSTLVLGRWFCGWACHLVLLQDLCGWIMRKLGVRPRPFRSRLLIYVPLLLALYMFVWPVFYRLAIAPWHRPGLEWPGFSVHLTTEEFWQTFPGVLVAIPFLLVCGFGAVYFLGAKGFCTYGCPYGGFFAPLDEFAPGRIRVTDACEGCGHCTAVCTSNVRVHEEVRDHGMVIDPGCMKCLDCVSVCPNDALYYGFGRPAQFKKTASRAKRRYDLTWGEELAFAGVFALVFFSVRGIYGVVPMLMAGGVAGVVTFMAWKAWRLTRDADVRFHKFQLRRAGLLSRGGGVFLAVTAIVLLLCAHSGVVRGAWGLGTLFERELRVAADVVLSGGNVGVAQRSAAERAAACYRLASAVGEGGVALAGDVRVDVRLAWLAACIGDHAAARRYLDRAFDRGASPQRFAHDYARLLRLDSRNEEALKWYRTALEAQPGNARVRADLAAWAQADGPAEAIEEMEAALRRSTSPPDARLP